MIIPRTGPSSRQQKSAGLIRAQGHPSDLKVSVISIHRFLGESGKPDGPLTLSTKDPVWTTENPSFGSFVGMTPRRPRGRGSFLASSRSRVNKRMQGRVGFDCHPFDFKVSLVSSSSFLASLEGLTLLS